MGKLLTDMYMTGCQRLRQWARASVSRVVGTTSSEDGKYKTMLSIVEGQHVLRAEVSAITEILIKNKIVDSQEIFKSFVDSMNSLETALREEWPEFDVADDGTALIIKDTEALVDRQRRESWPT